MEGQVHKDLGTEAEQGDKPEPENKPEPVEQEAMVEPVEPMTTKAELGATGVPVSH